MLLNTNNPNNIKGQEDLLKVKHVDIETYLDLLENDEIEPETEYHIEQSENTSDCLKNYTNHYVELIETTVEEYAINAKCTYPGEVKPGTKLYLKLPIFSSVHQKTARISINDGENYYLIKYPDNNTMNALSADECSGSYLSVIYTGEELNMFLLDSVNNMYMTQSGTVLYHTGIGVSSSADYDLKLPKRTSVDDGIFTLADSLSCSVNTDDRITDLPIQLDGTPIKMASVEFGQLPNNTGDAVIIQNVPKTATIINVCGMAVNTVTDMSYPLYSIRGLDVSTFVSGEYMILNMIALDTDLSSFTANKVFVFYI